MALTVSAEVNKELIIFFIARVAGGKSVSRHLNLQNIKIIDSYHKSNLTF
jgi:hypothetical protein